MIRALSFGRDVCDRAIGHNEAPVVLSSRRRRLAAVFGETRVSARVD
jgi:hypothetical protein